VVARGRRGKDDRKHSTLAPSLKTINFLRQHPQGLMKKGSECEFEYIKSNACRDELKDD
jgi:hypothetical protein